MHQQRVELAEGFLEEAQVVTDVLRRRVDLVRDAGRELANGLELLRLAQVVFEAVALLERLLEHGDVREASLPAREGLGRVVERRGIDDHVQLVAAAILDVGFPTLDHALARDEVEEVGTPAGLEQQVEEVDLAERDALASQQFHAGGVGSLEHAVVVGGEQRDGHVVEEILVAARGAHQVAVKHVAFHRVGNDA